MFKKLLGKLVQHPKENLSNGTHKEAPVSPETQAVSEWDVATVCQWLEKKQLGAYKSSFQKNCINGESLCDLSTEDLIKLGVTKIGHQKLLMKLIRKLNDCHSPVFANHGDIGSPTKFQKGHPLQKNSPLMNEKDDSCMVSISDDVTSSSDEDMDDMKPNPLPSESLIPKEIEGMGSMLDDFVDAIIIVDTSKIIRYFNKSAELMFGYSREDMIGCNVKILIPEPHRSNHDQYWDNYVESGSKSKIVGKGRMVRGRAKDGLEFPLYITVQFHTLSSTSEKIYVASIKDLRSVQPQTQKKISAISSLLNNMVNACIVIGKDSLIQLFNNSAEQMFGYSQSEVLGKDVSILMPERVASIHERYVSRYLETGKAKIIGKGRKEVARRKDGTEFQIWLTIAETKWGDDNEMGFMATIHEFKELVPVHEHDANIKSNGHHPISSSNVPSESNHKPKKKYDFELESLLDHPSIKPGLFTFMKSCKNNEIIEFLENVDKFRVLKSNRFRIPMAIAIKDKYIKCNAPKELNLPHKIKSELLERILGVQHLSNVEVECSPLVFQNAIDSVMYEICQDIIPRFLESAEGIALIKQYKDELI